jgi:predicted RNase H-like HicB family nuclease
LVVLEKANRSYSAYAPEVPGCIASGTTIEATLENMREALEIHLHSMADDGDEMPEIATVVAQFLDIEVGRATKVAS